MEQKIKKLIYKQWWFWVGIFVVLFIVIGSSSDDSATPDNLTPAQQIQTNSENTVVQETPGTQVDNTPEPIKTAETAQQSLESPAPTKQYIEVFNFTGNGAKKSEPFTIVGGRFKIGYNCSGEFCQAFLFKTSSKVMSELIMNAIGPITDETIVYGSGEYYINANTVGNYTMTVYDYR